MDLESLHDRVLSGITEEQFNQEYFYLTIPQCKLKNILEYRCDKNILNGKNCFKCAYNMYPNRKTGTICNILHCAFHNKVEGNIFINHPQKSVCAFCKTR